MFTGIIEATAEVLENSAGRLVLARPRDFTDVDLGSSICVSGVCLTVVELTVESVHFETVPETLKKSILGGLKKGDRVNLERALKMGDRFEGHVVQGHVQGVVEVLECKRTKIGDELKVKIPEGLSTFIITEGSITLDGVSLTVAELNGNECSVALIPHTLEHTTLAGLQLGDQLNIETDILVRHLLTHNETAALPTH